MCILLKSPFWEVEIRWWYYLHLVNVLAFQVGKYWWSFEICTTFWLSLHSKCMKPVPIFVPFASLLSEAFKANEYGVLVYTQRWSQLPGEPPILDDADVDDWLPRFVVLQGQCLYYYLKSTGKFFFSLFGYGPAIRSKMILVNGGIRILCTWMLAVTELVTFLCFRSEPTRIDTVVWCCWSRAASKLCARRWKDEICVLPVDPSRVEVWMLQYFRNTGNRELLWNAENNTCDRDWFALDLVIFQVDSWVRALSSDCKLRAGAGDDKTKTTSNQIEAGSW